jgi:hypothetical protein
MVARMVSAAQSPLNSEWRACAGCRQVKVVADRLLSATAPLVKCVHVSLILRHGLVRTDMLPLLRKVERDGPKENFDPAALRLSSLASRTGSSIWNGWALVGTWRN